MAAHKPTRHKRKAQRMPQDSAIRRTTQTEKQRRALALRTTGASYEQIAQAMGYRTRAGAWVAVQEALRKTLQEPADEVRKLELARLDRWLLTIWPQIQAGSLEALDRGLKIQAQRTYYITGLKVPQQVAPTSPDGTQPYQPFGPQGIADEFVGAVAGILAQYGQLAEHENGTGAGAEIK